MPIRIILADDHPVVRAGLRHLLESEPEMVVVGEAADGVTACRLAAQLCPDVLVLDISLPARTAVNAMRDLTAGSPKVRVVTLTVHEDPAYLHDMLQAGACGYVLKRSASNELVRAIRTIAQGGSYTDPAIAATLITGFLEGRTPPLEAADGLSAREREVVTRIAQGYRNVDIAVQLQISVKTVESYKARVVEKLGLHSPFSRYKPGTRCGNVQSP